MEDVNAKLETITNTLTEMGKQFTELRTELKEDIAGVRAELKEDIAGVRAELREDIANVETNLRGEISAVERNLRDEIKALEHKNNVRFDELAAGQAKFQAQLTRLEERLFYEEGTRETQAEVLYREHKGDAKKLRQQVRDHEQRLKRLEQQAA